MRDEPNIRLEPYRRNDSNLGPSPAGANFGYFVIGEIRIVSSGTDDVHGWEHVSASLPSRTPTWSEMVQIKDLFWKDDETVVQFHPRKEAYINRHPFCLHLWRRIGVETMLPPKELIG